MCSRVDRSLMRRCPRALVVGRSLSLSSHRWVLELLWMSLGEGRFYHLHGRSVFAYPLTAILPPTTSPPSSFANVSMNVVISDYLHIAIMTIVSSSCFLHGPDTTIAANSFLPSCQRPRMLVVNFFAASIPSKRTSMVGGQGRGTWL